MNSNYDELGYFILSNIGKILSLIDKFYLIINKIDEKFNNDVIYLLLKLFNDKEFFKYISLNYPEINFEIINNENNSFDVRIGEVRKFYDLLKKDHLMDSIKYNYSKTLDYLRIHSPYIYDNLDIIKDYLDEYKSNNVYNIGFIESEMSYLSLSSIIETIGGFFNFFDDSKTISNEFYNYQFNGNILFWDSKDNIPEEAKKYFGSSSDNYCFAKDSNKINAPLKYNLWDVFALVHEFVHYLYDNRFIESNIFGNLFDEFPPIFFEKLLPIYLLNIGIDENEVFRCCKYRADNTMSSIFNYYKHIKCLSKIKNDEDISIEDFKQEHNVNRKYFKNDKAFNKYNDAIKELFNFFNKEENIIVILEKEFDEINSFNFPQDLLISLNYFIADHLSTSIIKKNSYESIKEFMIKFSNIRDNFETLDMDMGFFYLFFNDYESFYRFRNEDTGKTFMKRIESK